LAVALSLQGSLANFASGLLLLAFRMVRIGDLIELPRADLPIRFGPEVLRRLDQALGRLPEVLTGSYTPLTLQTIYSV